MTFSISEEAMERAEHAIAVAAVFHMEIDRIAQACLQAPTDTSVVVVVGWDLRCTMWFVPTAELAARQPQLEQDGWSLVFDAGTNSEVLAVAVARMARLAEARRDALHRYMATH